MKKNNTKITYLSRPGEELESVVERALVLSVASGGEVVSSECDGEVVRAALQASTTPGKKISGFYKSRTNITFGDSTL